MGSVVIPISLAPPLNVGHDVALGQRLAIPLSLDFDAVNIFSLNLNQSGSFAGFGMVQGIFFDARLLNGLSKIEIQSLVSSQTIVVQGQTQGYRLLLCPNPAQILFDGTGTGGHFNCQLLNYPVDNQTWQVALGI